MNSEIINDIELLLPEQNAGIIDKEIDDSTMSVLEVNGADVVGLLQYETNNILYPVYSAGNVGFLSLRPYRVSGNAENGTLIIGANNFKGMFDFSESIDAGEKFTFTDVYGHTFKYSVSKIEHKSVFQKDDISSDEYDLTLLVRVSLNKLLVVRCKSV